MSGAWIPVDPPRELTEWERSMVQRFTPRAEQGAVEALRVIDRCGCGCSSVGFTKAEHFPVGQGEARDSDGMLIWVMLFADRDETRLATLDVLRADSQPIATLPPTHEVTISTTSGWTGTAAAGT